MKIRYLILALLPFSIVACQSMPQNSTSSSQVTMQQVDANKVLSSYSWSYQPESAPQPIVLNFNKDRLTINTGCNNQGGSWKVENNQIVTTVLMSTMKACEPALMANEKFSNALFNNRKINFKLNTTASDQPVLTITGVDGKTYNFTGKMTPEAMYQSEGETVFLEVSPKTQQCSAGAGQKECLLVREIKYDANGVKTYADKDFHLFYNNVDGYVHKADQRVILRVKRFENKHPAADQSKYVYINDLVVEQETVTQ